MTEETYQRLRRVAKKEKRTIPNLIEVLVEQREGQEVAHDA